MGMKGLLLVANEGVDLTGPEGPHQINERTSAWVPPFQARLSPHPQAQSIGKTEDESVTWYISSEHYN